MTIEEAIRVLIAIERYPTSIKGKDCALEMAISALQAQQNREKRCEECTGILYRQTTSGKIVPCDKICAGKLPR